jgi:PadR family transcriptional regulator PadR
LTRKITTATRSAGRSNCDRVEKAGQRRRRYYRITDSGRAMLATQREDWARFIAALTEIAGVKPA